MPRPVPSTPPGPPVVQRLTVRYAKRGRMRFASHRDLARAIERGVRKAALPVAYSAGFSPHPKISYPGGAPTGVASEAEYAEIALTGWRDPSEVRGQLDAALPDGIDVIEVTELGPGQSGPDLAASAWEVLLPGVAPAAARAAADAFLAAPAATVERLTNKGVRRLDARAAVAALAHRRAGDGPHAGCAILRMVVRQMTPAVRPDDILAALCAPAQGGVPVLAPSSPPLVTRLAQGPLDEVTAVALTAGGTGEAEVHGRSAAEQYDKTAGQHAETAGPAPAAGAHEFLPRGAEGPDADLSAREPDGRDCPDARNRAAEPRIRI
jgi:radical SAM-linked protein